MQPRRATFQCTQPSPKFARPTRPQQQARPRAPPVLLLGALAGQVPGPAGGQGDSRAKVRGAGQPARARDARPVGPAAQAHGSRPSSWQLPARQAARQRMGPPTASPVGVVRLSVQAAVVDNILKGIVHQAWRGQGVRRSSSEVECQSPQSGMANVSTPSCAPSPLLCASCTGNAEQSVNAAPCRAGPAAHRRRSRCSWGRSPPAAARIG